MTITLSNADGLFALLHNNILFGLLSKREFQLFPGCYVTVANTIDFSLYSENDSIVIEMRNAKPNIRLGMKSFLSINGTINKVIINADSIIFSIDGLPDLTIKKG